LSNLASFSKQEHNKQKEISLVAIFLHPEETQNATKTRYILQALLSGYFGIIVTHTSRSNALQL